MRRGTSGQGLVDAVVGAALVGLVLAPLTAAIGSAALSAGVAGGAAPVLAAMEQEVGAVRAAGVTPAEARVGCFSATATAVMAVPPGDLCPAGFPIRAEVGPIAAGARIAVRDTRRDSPPLTLTVMVSP